MLVIKVRCSFELVIAISRVLICQNSGARAIRRNKRILGNAKFIFLHRIYLRTVVLSTSDTFDYCIANNIGVLCFERLKVTFKLCVDHFFPSLERQTIRLT